MNQFDYYVAVAFALVILFLGLMFSRSGKSMTSFFAAGGAVPWWISGLSLFMSFFSVGTFVVWGSIAYSDGLVAVVIQSTMAVAGIIIGCIIAPAWNKTRALTVADYLTHRAGKSVQKIYSSAFLFINLFTAGAFLYPVGKIIEVSTGIPLNMAILVLGLFVIAYTTVGGLWAVLVTDVLQFVVLTAAVLIIIPLAFGEVGGVNTFLSKLPDGFMALQNENYSWIFLIAFVIYNTVFIGGNWAYVQRYTSVAKPKDARKVGLLFGGLYLVAPIIWMLPPMIYRVINPDLSGTEAEEAYLLMSKLVVPEGLLGLILAAMVFATASSVNTAINIAAGVFTNDLFKSIKPNYPAQRLMKVARISTFVFGFLAITVALAVQSMGGIVEVVLSIAALTGASLYLPPIWAIFSKRQTGKSLLLTTLFSLLINAFFKFVTPSLFDLSLSREWEMMLGVITPVIWLIGFEVYYYRSRSTNPDYDNYIEYQLSRETQDAPNSEVQASDNTYSKKILSIGILAIGILLICLGAVTDSANAETLGVGLIIALPALWFLLKTNKVILGAK
ncbi:sodium:solute symporter family protein [uncultured Paraglaciecola sp.]|uniref:sodium:solute symporter family protein n=1 Tax=uncultured Paraglaciecola sp. TaxID=1765024 RepID=UPI0030DD5906|tara:strand:- start:27804 stop:29477 length:1674 start_codon:yes stop_codon:yes gene_type:complete